MHGSFSSSSIYPLELKSQAHLLVFLLSSNWVRRFFIHRSFSSPSPSFAETLKVFSIYRYHPQLSLLAILIYILVGACVLERR